jgi:hypothetical protein
MGTTGSKRKAKSARQAALDLDAAQTAATSSHITKPVRSSNSSPAPTKAEPRPTSVNPRFNPSALPVAERVVGGKVFVCSAKSIGGVDSATTILHRELPKPAYNVELVDNVEACTHMILVASIMFCENDEVVANLEKAMALGKTVIVMHEMPGAPGGGEFATVTDGMPSKYDALKSQEWVGLHRDGHFLPASLLTALRQAGLARGQTTTTTTEREHFDFFLSHKQTTSQGTCMTMYQILQDKFEFKVGDFFSDLLGSVVISLITFVFNTAVHTP